jgi:hypothetical protein
MSPMMNIDLPFATPEIASGLTGDACPRCGLTGFIASVGRNGDTLVYCKSCSKTEEGRFALLTWFRKQGYTLSRTISDAKPLKQITAIEDLMAFKALCRAEMRMVQLLRDKGSQSYNEFVAEGIHREAISKGIRVLEALGLIRAERKPYNARSHRYDRNVYHLIEGGGLAFEPTSRKDRKAALQRAKDVASLARNGRVRRNKETNFTRASEVRNIVASEVRQIDDSEVRNIVPNGGNAGVLEEVDLDENPPAPNWDIENGGNAGDSEVRRSISGNGGNQPFERYGVRGTTNLTTTYDASSSTLTKDRDSYPSFRIVPRKETPTLGVDAASVEREHLGVLATHLCAIASSDPLPSWWSVTGVDAATFRQVGWNPEAWLEQAGLLDDGGFTALGVKVMQYVKGG